MHTNRRHFLATALASPALAASRLGPNDRVRVAVVGLRGRGQSLIKGFHNLAKQNVEIVAFCDVDQKILETRAAGYQSLSGRKIQIVNDMRRILDDKDIHVVGFATPNHWHALGAVWACQAGKDVYVEKPGSHTVWEGRKIMEAASKYKRIVQHGTQNRSSPNIVEAVRKIREGVIGRVYMARGVAFKTRAALGPMTTDPVPEGLDWDRWLGPAPKVPYSKRRQSAPAGGSWHMIWDYGNGEIGNQGVHELDIMRWALDLNMHPTRVASMGGKFVHPGDGYDAPQMQAMMFEYKGRDVQLTFETRSGYTNDEAGMGTTYPFLDKKNVVGVIFVGTEGYMILPDYSSYHTFLGPKREKGPSAVGDNDISDQPHFDNFLNAVRSGKPGDLNAPPEQLHYSATMAHLANISYRTGRMVHFDSKTERIVGDTEANRMLSKTYREPYVLPEKV